MQAHLIDNVVEKLRTLSPERIAEVEDFVDFLRMRADEQHLIQAATRASEASFAAVWDNDEDFAYDQL